MSAILQRLVQILQNVTKIIKTLFDSLFQYIAEIAYYKTELAIQSNFIVNPFHSGYR